MKASILSQYCMPGVIDVKKAVASLEDCKNTCLSWIFLAQLS